MVVTRNWQGTRVILLVYQFQASLDASLDASLNAKLFMSKDLAEIIE